MKANISLESPVENIFLCIIVFWIVIIYKLQIFFIVILYKKFQYKQKLI